MRDSIRVLRSTSSCQWQVSVPGITGTRYRAQRETLRCRPCRLTSEWFSRQVPARGTERNGFPTARGSRCRQTVSAGLRFDGRTVHLHRAAQFPACVSSNGRNRTDDLFDRQGHAGFLNHSCHLPSGFLCDLHGLAARPAGCCRVGRPIQLCDSPHPSHARCYPGTHSTVTLQCTCAHTRLARVFTGVAN